MHNTTVYLLLSNVAVHCLCNISSMNSIMIWITLMIAILYLTYNHHKLLSSVVLLQDRHFVNYYS